MTEKLLQFIWQFQYYNFAQLQTTHFEALQILHPGQYNTDQGPDFLNAKIKIGNTIWAGSIELHVNASDWVLHKHSSDKNYANVVLHVVWQQNGKETVPFATLELCNRVSNVLLTRYESLMNNQSFIPCGEKINTVPEITFFAWKERLLAERLEQRTAHIKSLLDQNTGHWEETFWWVLAGNFGLKINSEAFENIARSIPINLLAKNSHSIHLIEALLFGQAQMLHDYFDEDYPKMLRKEYLFLQKKCKLSKLNMPLYFLRMRPANFPSVRLAQLSMLICKSHNLFASIRETNDLNAVMKIFEVTANDYWHYHYEFDVPGNYKPKTLGKNMLQNIMINTVVPMLFAYGHIQDSAVIKQKALRWIEQIPAEHNTICKGFAAFGLENKKASDSQAYLQLKNEYCNKKYCLQCSVGNSILKQSLGK